MVRGDVQLYLHHCREERDAAREALREARRNGLHDSPGLFAGEGCARLLYRLDQAEMRLRLAELGMLRPAIEMAGGAEPSHA